MSTEYPTLAEVAAIHVSCDSSERIDNDEELGQHIADEWRDACTIRTAEQLDALPLGSILLTAADNPVQKAFADGLWRTAHKDRPFPPQLMIGFILIHHPDWSK